MTLLQQIILESVSIIRKNIGNKNVIREQLEIIEKYTKQKP